MRCLGLHRFHPTNPPGPNTFAGHDNIGAAMDFTLPPEIEDIRVRTRAFIAEHVLPLEADPMQHYRPAWHSGSHWSSTDFSSSVASTVSSASAAFASAVPVSSSSSGFSSGGGGSGGGGGGGGGGGW